MTGLRRFVLLMIVGALLALGVAGWLTRSAAAQELGFIVGSDHAVVGEEVSVDLEARDMPAPGLGAWTIDVMYDEDFLEAVSCTDQTSLTVCNPDFADGTIRVAGASIEALEGNIGLANMVFKCVGAGEGDLIIVAQILVDETLGDPQPIDAATESGSITCTAAEAEVAPTPTVAGLAPTGTGGQPETGDIVRWLIAAFAGVGLAGIVSFGVLRLRAGRS